MRNSIRIIGTVAATPLCALLILGTTVGQASAQPKKQQPSTDINVTMYSGPDYSTYPPVQTTTTATYFDGTSWKASTSYGELRQIGHGNGTHIRLFLKKGTKLASGYADYGSIRDCGYTWRTWNGKDKLPAFQTVTGWNGAPCTVSLTSVFVMASNFQLPAAPQKGGGML